jgi:hypothetical protein
MVHDGEIPGGVRAMREVVPFGKAGGVGLEPCSSAHSIGW